MTSLLAILVLGLLALVSLTVHQVHNDGNASAFRVPPTGRMADEFSDRHIFFNRC